METALNVGGFNSSFNYGSLGNGFGFGTTTRTTTPTTPTPTGTTIATKSIEEEGTLDFVTSDFTYTNGDAVSSLQIVDLPDNGTLTLNGNAVGLNQIITVGDFDDIQYVPDDYFDETDTFSVRLSSDGTTYDTSNSNVSISVVGSDDLPTVGYTFNAWRY